MRKYANKKYNRYQKQFDRKPQPAGTKMKRLAEKSRLDGTRPQGITADYFRNLTIEKNLEKIRQRG